MRLIIIIERNFSLLEAGSMSQSEPAFFSVMKPYALAGNIIMKRQVTIVNVTNLAGRDGPLMLPP